MNADKEKNSHVLNVFIFLCVIFLVFLAFTGEKSISEIRMEMAEVQQEQEAKALEAARREAKGFADHELEEVPVYFQWDSEWAGKSYANGNMEDSGCGPTCMSMVAVYFTGNEDMTPAWMADFSTENGYIMGGKTAWTLLGEGAEKIGLQVKQMSPNEKDMKKELDLERVMICSMGPGDFTKGGHFIVIIGYDEDGFIVRDPNNKENNEKSWNYDQISGQIKNIWTYWM